MCEFISWIKYRGRNWYLTREDLRTKEGKALRQYLGAAFLNDIKGHGAIRHYYGIHEGKGTNRECDDFSTPDNFPPEIAKAMKEGLFRGIGVPPHVGDVLVTPALKAYGEAVAPALKAWDEAVVPALKAWDEAADAALKAWGEAVASAFWDLWADPSNRIAAWQ